MRRMSNWISLLALLAMLVAGGCNGTRLPSATSPTPGTTPQPTTPAASPTPLPPTATPIPLAARVNGEAIPLAAFQTSLAQLQKADADLKKTVLEADERKQALDDLIDQALLAQQAKTDG